MRQYKLLQWQARAGEFADSPEVRSLTDEIGILRFTLEEILKKCGNENELLCYQPQIMQTTVAIQRLVESAQKLDEKNNLLLDRKIIMNIADALITLLTQHVKDAVVLDILGTEVFNVITGAIRGSYADRSSKT